MFLFFFKSTPTTEIYTLSLHDALPIWMKAKPASSPNFWINKIGSDRTLKNRFSPRRRKKDRKSTRLNSSHRCISYAVFCLKKKIKNHRNKLAQNAMK